MGKQVDYNDRAMANCILYIKSEAITSIKLFEEEVDERSLSGKT